MKKVSLVLSFVIAWQTLCMDGFSYPHKEYIGISNHLYKDVLSGSISSLDQLKVNILNIDKKKMTDVEFNTAIVRALYRIYLNPDLTNKLGKENVFESMLIYATNAAKEGSIQVFSVISAITNGSASVCSHAMKLMLTGELKDCILLKQEAVSVFPSNYDEKLQEIFGTTVKIPDDYPEDDHGRLRLSPVQLCFSKENIETLETFLQKNPDTNKQVCSLLREVLKDWKKLAK